MKLEKRKSEICEMPKETAVLYSNVRFPMFAISSNVSADVKQCESYSWLYRYAPSAQVPLFRVSDGGPSRAQYKYSKCNECNTRIYNNNAQLTQGLRATARDSAVIPRWPSTAVLDIIVPEIAPFDPQTPKTLTYNQTWSGSDVPFARYSPLNNTVTLN